MGLDLAQMHAELLAEKPEGAVHDSETCLFCLDRADAMPDLSQGEGDNSNKSRDMGGSEDMPDQAQLSQETHDALVDKAVKDATAQANSELEVANTELATLREKSTALQGEVDTLKTDNARLNSELDTAQLGLKTATDRATKLESDLATQVETARLAKVGVERLAQVKNLAIFTDDYATEKITDWASLTDDAWTSRVTEWKALKPTTTEGTGAADTASAMTGSSGSLTDTATSAKSLKRQILGL